MATLAPPRPQRRPLSIASARRSSVVSDILDHPEIKDKKVSATSVTIKEVKDSRSESPNMSNPLSHGFVLENESDSDSDYGSASTTPTASPSFHRVPLPPLLDPIPRITPLPPRSNSIFGAASSLMAAVTAARGKNMIIGPCTCRTCSVGCLVALVAMATGRVEQLQEDVCHKDSNGCSIIETTPALTTGLNEANTKLRDLVCTLAHLQFFDPECRILQATGTQFVVALPHVQVDYLRTRKQIVGSPVRSASKEPGQADTMSSTSPLHIRRRTKSNRSGSHSSGDLSAGESSEGSVGNFCWGVRRNSINSLSAKPQRPARRSRSYSASTFGAEEGVGALQVILEATPTEAERIMFKTVPKYFVEERLVRKAKASHVNEEKAGPLLSASPSSPSPPETPPLKTPDTSPDSSSASSPDSTTTSSPNSTSASSPNSTSASSPEPWKPNLVRSRSRLRRRPTITTLLRSVIPDGSSPPGLCGPTDYPLSPGKVPCYCTPSNIEAVRHAQQVVKEAVDLRRDLSSANAENELLRNEKVHLEETIAVLRGRLAATETMLDTYEDLTREGEDERHRLESDKFILEMENIRLEKKNALLLAAKFNI